MASDLPAEFNVVFGMQKGAVSNIIKSAYGYHIFMLEDIRKAGRLGLEDASKEIVEKLRREKEDRRYKSWMKELRSRTKFEVNYQALGSAGPRKEQQTGDRSSGDNP